MRNLVIAGILTALAFPLGVTTTRAGVPTPTPTPTPVPTATPAPTATPTPVPTSEITIRFVSDGQLHTIEFANWVPDVFADGVECVLYTDTPIAQEKEMAEFTVWWPIAFHPVNPIQCSEPPPTALRFDWGGGLYAEFVWVGEDVTIDLEVPAVWLTPTPTPTPPVTDLPPTGTSGEAPGGALVWPMVGVGLLLVSAGGALLRLRRA